MNEEELDQRLRDALRDCAPEDPQRLEAAVMEALARERGAKVLEIRRPRRNALRWSVAAATAIVLLFGIRPWQRIGKGAADVPIGVMILAPVVEPKGDPLLARLDSDSILLDGHRELNMSDPLLRPHSKWDQEPIQSL